MTFLKRTFFCGVFLCALVPGLSSTVAAAPPPPGYYDPAEGKLGEELRLALAGIISGHNRISYSWPPFYLLDQDPENSNNLLLVYSGFSKPHDSHHEVWNREHLWPRSRGLGTGGSAHDDLFNLTPADPGVNSARGNLAFGYPDPGHPNYVPPGHYKEAPLASRDSLRWLPPEFDRGFIARAMFYMATRYNGEGTEPNLTLTDNPPNGTPWGAEMGELNVFLDWNRKHAPTEFEVRRNRLIYEQFQFNRNPFIDYPDLVDAAFTADLYLAPGTWRINHFSFEELNDAAISGWDADPDGDGRINLLEYALGLDPRQAGSGEPLRIFHETNSEGKLAPFLIYRKVKDAALWGLTYLIEASFDLQGWTEVLPVASSITDDEPWHRQVSLELPVEEEDAPRQFFRVRISLEGN